MCLCYFSQHGVSADRPFVHIYIKSLICWPATRIQRSNLWLRFICPTPSPNTHKHDTEPQIFEKEGDFFYVDNLSNCRRPLRNFLFILYSAYLVLTIHYHYKPHKQRFFLLCIYTHTDYNCRRCKLSVS